MLRFMAWLTPLLKWIKCSYSSYYLYRCHQICSRSNDSLEQDRKSIDSEGDEGQDEDIEEQKNSQWYFLTMVIQW